MTTISPAYLVEQQKLHQNPGYGVASVDLAPYVAAVIRSSGASSLGDYGAGKCRLQTALRDLGIEVDYRPYDPAYPEYGGPQRADLVTCVDVLEHVEPDCLPAVLRELSQITVRLGFFTVHTGPAVKHLSDGRNAHLIQRPMAWWLDNLSTYFDIVSAEDLVPERDSAGFWVLVAPLSSKGGQSRRL